MTLNEIQKTLKAPKGQFNSFGKYKYRSQEDILEAVKPLLGDATLTLTDEIVVVGTRYYVRATATLHDGEKETTVTAFAREPEDKKGMDESQITGAASSYARKYALNGLFLIDDARDADTQDNSSSKKVASISVATLRQMIKDAGYKESNIAQKFNVATIEELDEKSKKVLGNTLVQKLGPDYIPVV
jgi:hypothetical protein